MEIVLKVKTKGYRSL